jgi:hypothetical protein
LTTAFAEHLGDAPPSTNRFYTFEPTLVNQTGILMIHDLGAAVGDIAFDGGDDDGDESGGDDPDNFHKYAAQKSKKSKDAFTDPQHKVTMMVSLWASEALDKFNSIMQHADFAGKGLLDAVYHSGPLSDCELELFIRVTSAPECNFPLMLLVQHFEADPALDGYDTLLFGFRSIMKLYGQLFCRIIMVLNTYPFVLLGLVDKRLSQQDRPFLFSGSPPVPKPRDSANKPKIRNQKEIQKPSLYMCSHGSLFFIM